MPSNDHQDDESESQKSPFKHPQAKKLEEYDQTTAIPQGIIQKMNLY